MKRPTAGDWEADLDDEWRQPHEGCEYKGVPPYKGRYWAYSQERMREFAEQGRLVYVKSGMPNYKRYLDEMPGVPLQDIWTDVAPILNSKERVGYPTQKPHHPGQQQSRRYGTRSFLRMCHGLHCRREGRTSLGRDRPFTKGCRPGHPAGGVRTRGLVQAKPPRRCTQAQRPRTDTPLPDPKAHAVRTAGGILQRLPYSVPVPQFHD